MSATASLGELLMADRATLGLDLGELSRSSGLAVDRIAAVESGRHDLTDAELCQLLDRYVALTPSRRPFRALVEIDLDAGTLRLRRTRRPRSLPAADRNLLHYLALLHRCSGLQPGSAIPLKAVDLSLLRASLALRRGEVTSRLDRMAGVIGPGLVRNRSLLAAAIGTGVVVAAGAIVLIPSGRSDTDRAPAGGAIDPRIDIGTPLVVERPPSEIPGFGPPDLEVRELPDLDRPETGLADPPADQPDPGAPDGDTSIPGTGSAAIPAPRIGTPLVVERPASAAAPTPPITAGNGPRGPPIDDLMISS